MCLAGETVTEAATEESTPAAVPVPAVAAKAT